MPNEIKSKQKARIELTFNINDIPYSPLIIQLNL